MNASALVDLVNRQLAQHGAVFEVRREIPLGPLGTSLYGSVKGFPARIDFIINPADDRRSVVLYDLRSKESAAERPAAASFQEAVLEYPWPAAIAALKLL
ncbi:hypothetical protein [Microbacterium sp. VKM Ac-2923]|uniref:hypothetical protein n=1 Tax=Microbacterium sp. VKM Ac-2923 TaxID=2929476 RepID=UPI001FB3DE59|nr:hypothetical protein [Microbacterium sp. VKM Ac-2923]MCJ1709412.1 hypothetical protein [Microbacterium sp. VKM Ac-2923]